MHLPRHIKSLAAGILMSLSITATAFAIAYKKVEMVDIRRIQDEEDL